jgi:hypothetical protein
MSWLSAWDYAVQLRLRRHRVKGDRSNAGELIFVNLRKVRASKLALRQVRTYIALRRDRSVAPGDMIQHRRTTLGAGWQKDQIKQ